MKTFDDRKYGRFELSFLAAYRARALYAGAEPLIENTQDDKLTVVALKEFTSGTLKLDDIKDELLDNALKESTSILDGIEEYNADQKDSVDKIDAELNFSVPTTSDVEDNPIDKKVEEKVVEEDKKVDEEVVEEESKPVKSLPEEK
ncbi:MAG: DNA-directed RNA polymerase subunit omega [Alphaproteobacteria bacterium]|nr:DNA-directed RNA polymerase subunit omega [Alphaproteobacteria bacterium]